MIETLPFQPHQRILLPVMLHMTPRTVRLPRRRLVHPRMISSAAFHTALNLAVTLQALETSCPCPEIMTVDTFRHTLQCTMRTG